MSFNTDKLLFTKHLAIMLKAGIPIAEAIETVSDQSANSGFKKILTSIYKDVSEGRTLQTALSRYPKVFDAIYINLVRTGEESGDLDESLKFLTEQLERDGKFRQKVIAASMYPSIVLITAFIVSAQISLYVLPKLTDLFQSMDVDLPITTKILLWFADLMKYHGYEIFGGIFALGVLFRLTLLNKKIRYAWQSLILKLPTIGNFNRNIEMAIICRNIGTMLRSGVPIAKTLDTLSLSTSNLIFRDYLRDLLKSVTMGTTFSSELRNKKYKYIPKIAVKMIGVGEKTGKLDESFIYLGDYFEDEVDNLMKNLSTILEPALLLVIGFFVAFLALAIITPIYQFTGSIHN